MGGMRAERRPTSTRPAGLRGEPGNGGGRQRLGISRLQAEHGYDVAGAVEDELTPDASGKAAIEVDLDRRAEVRLSPRS